MPPQRREFGFMPQRGEQGISDLTGVGQSLGEFHASSPLLESLRGATGVPPLQFLNGKAKHLPLRTRSAAGHLSLLSCRQPQLTLPCVVRG